MYRFLCVYKYIDLLALLGPREVQIGGEEEGAADEHAQVMGHGGQTVATDQRLAQDQVRLLDVPGREHTTGERVRSSW